MARTRTLAQLRDEVRQRADIENDPHISDTEINRFINQSGAAMHAELVDMNEGYFEATMDVTTVAAQPWVSLDGGPSNIYKLTHVAANLNGTWRPLDRFTQEQRTRLLNSSNTWGWGLAPTPRYAYRRIQSGSVKLDLAPTPDGVYTIRVYYVPSFTDMAADTDVFDGADGWEEWVVLDAAIKCLVKEEGNTTDLTRERDAVWARISKQMRTPDENAPAHVRDVDTYDGGAWPFGYLP